MAIGTLVNGMTKISVLKDKGLSSGSMAIIMMASGSKASNMAMGS